MNTRKYPRTMVEAFPNTTDYACALERPLRRQTWWRTALILVCCFCITMLMGAVQTSPL